MGPDPRRRADRSGHAGTLAPAWPRRRRSLCGLEWGPLENLGDKLVWLATVQQARLLYQRMGIREAENLDALNAQDGLAPGEDLAVLHHLMLEKLGA